MIRSDGLWRFACGDVFTLHTYSLLLITLNFLQQSTFGCSRLLSCLSNDHPPLPQLQWRGTDQWIFLGFFSYSYGRERRSTTGERSQGGCFTHSWDQHWQQELAQPAKVNYKTLTIRHGFLRMLISLTILTSFDYQNDHKWLWLILSVCSGLTMFCPGETCFF